MINGKYQFKNKQNKKQQKQQQKQQKQFYMAESFTYHLPTIIS